MIKHLPGPFPTRSRAVIHEGRVHAVSFVTDKQPDMYRQTKSALAHIDATLQEAGTDKSRILTAIVYIADMARKPEMNRAWDEWADRNSPPMRACLAVTAGGDRGHRGRLDNALPAHLRISPGFAPRRSAAGTGGTGDIFRSSGCRCRRPAIRSR